MKIAAKEIPEANVLVIERQIRLTALAAAVEAAVHK